MIERVNINAPPNYPKPEYKSTPSVEAQTCEALLLLILMELQKINKHFDTLMTSGKTISVKESND